MHRSQLGLAIDISRITREVENIPHSSLPSAGEAVHEVVQYTEMVMQTRRLSLFDRSANMSDVFQSLSLPSSNQLLLDDGSLDIGDLGRLSITLDSAGRSQGVALAVREDCSDLLLLLSR